MDNEFKGIDIDPNKEELKEWIKNKISALNECAKQLQSIRHFTYLTKSIQIDGAVVDFIISRDSKISYSPCHDSDADDEIHKLANMNKALDMVLKQLSQLISRIRDEREAEIKAIKPIPVLSYPGKIAQEKSNELCNILKTARDDIDKAIKQVALGSNDIKGQVDKIKETLSQVEREDIS